MQILLCFLLFGDMRFPNQPDIYLEIHQGPPSPVVMLAPHENEYLINETAIAHVKEKGGRILIVRQDGERLLKLRFEEGVALLDPNRMFTAGGIRSSIKRENKDISPELARKAIARAVQIGRFTLAQMELTDQSIIIALHNNTIGFDNDGQDGVGTVSMKRYEKFKKKGSFFLEDLNVGEHNEDDFFFITDRNDFEHMKKDGWNLVLQNPGVAQREDEDDGSLSVYAAQQGLRYFNIEAQRRNEEGKGKNHLKQQQAMFRYLMDYVGH